ncbi:MAG TPA: hypothetical protein VGP63_24370 [Planctomycetaceae bacterium]|jgi:hypothetical protein|nr:hypothetical protein [Planctomycetaceae bacterium]
MKSRIMYIEYKGDDLTGSARIGRVTFSQTGRTLYYSGKQFRKVRGGYKWNCYDVETEERYWISGCRHDGVDRLYGESTPVEIDDDVREEYWTTIRKRPEKVPQKVANR